MIAGECVSSRWHQTEAGAASILLHYGGPQGALLKAEVIAKILDDINCEWTELSSVATQTKEIPGRCRVCQRDVYDEHAVQHNGCIGHVHPHWRWRE